jgi:purine-binding chemotaxis protein CheW
MSGNGIDWDEVKRRLRDAEAAREKARADDPERLEGVYRERAARLAARQAQARAPATALRVLVFALGAERFALDFADLVELFPYAGCTRVPGGPAALLGVTNLRGEVRSVLDLGRLLDLPGADAGASGYLLLVRRQARETVLRVDGIDKIRSLLPEELATSADQAAGPGLRYLRGLTPDRVRVLNTEALFTHPLFGGDQGG